MLSDEETKLVVTLLRRFVKEKHNKLRRLRPLDGQSPDVVKHIKKKHTISINFAHKIIRKLEEA
jgi:hypothetical protein